MKQGDYEQGSLFVDRPSYSQKKRRKRKPLRKQEPEVTQAQESTSTASLFPPEPPYPPPRRASYVCQQIAWTWNGERYICTGDAQAHREYEVFLEKLYRRIFGQP